MNAVIVLPAELATGEEIIAHYAAARGRLGVNTWRKPIYLTPRMRVTPRPVALIDPIVSGPKRKLISSARNRAMVADAAIRHGLREKYLRKGGPRFAPVVRARHELFHRLRHEAGLPLETIGRVLGGFHHTTVLHGVRLHTDRLLWEAEHA